MISLFNLEVKLKGQPANQVRLQSVQHQNQIKDTSSHEKQDKHENASAIHKFMQQKQSKVVLAELVQSSLDLIKSVA